MRLLKAGCAAVLIGFCICYGVVISLPVERHKSTVSAALAATGKRNSELKARLRDPEQNGFLAPQFEAFWSKADNSGQVLETLTAWNQAYSSQNVGVRVDHRALLQAKDPDYLLARRRLEALLPGLVAAFAKPLFQPATTDPNAIAVTFNDQALTTLTLALTGYAESLLAEGSPEHAALVYELIFRMGSAMGKDAGIVPTMMGVSHQALAFQSLVGHLSPSSKLSPGQWAGLATAVAATAPTPLTMVATLEQDLVFGTAFLGGPRGGYDGDFKHLRGLYLLPGMRSRDLRAYHNLMGSLLEEARTGTISQAPPAPTKEALLAGKTGPGTSELMPNYQTQGARIAVHSAKMCALAATAGVCAYRAKYGKLPANLAELDQLNLRAPGGEPWSSARGILYEVKGAAALVGVQVPPEQLVRAGIDVETRQQQEAMNSSFFGMNERGYFFIL